jgi:hypothetical protein
VVAWMNEGTSARSCPGVGAPASRERGNDSSLAGEAKLPRMKQFRHSTPPTLLSWTLAVT